MGLLLFGLLIAVGCREQLTIPPVLATDQGELGVAIVLAGSKVDGGWSQSHAEGLEFVAATVPGVTPLIVENIPEYGDQNRLFNELARSGYDVIIGTGFGYMEAMAATAGQFLDVNFINVSGLKYNQDNFSNLTLAMEEMMYLAGMVAGARANQDQQQDIGMIASHIIPEQFRMINAAALGIAKTCNGCRIDVRWLKAWDDSTREEQYAKELFDDGAYIVLSSTGGTGALSATKDRHVYVIVTGRQDYCTDAKCLTAPYPYWGPVYAQIVQLWQSSDFRGGAIISHANQGGMGLAGFMPGQPLQPGLNDLPAEVIELIRSTLARFTNLNQNAWQEVFTGPISDNRGRSILDADKKLNLEDYDQFPPGKPDAMCNPCMYWYNANISSSLPDEIWLK